MRFILDADASIKLTKIGLIEILASEFNLILTDVVYDEHVIIGMNNNYPDAKIMKELVLKFDLIISDDEKFLRVLNELDLPFIPTAATILMCINRSLISKVEGMRFLNSLKFMIKNEHFYYIKNKIE